MRDILDSDSDNLTFGEMLRHLLGREGKETEQIRELRDQIGKHLVNLEGAVVQQRQLMQSISEDAIDLKWHEAQRMAAEDHDECVFVNEKNNF